MLAYAFFKLLLAQSDFPSKHRNENSTIQEAKVLLQQGFQELQHWGGVTSSAKQYVFQRFRTTMAQRLSLALSRCAPKASVTHCPFAPDQLLDTEMQGIPLGLSSRLSIGGRTISRNISFSELHAMRALPHRHVRGHVGQSTPRQTYVFPEGKISTVLA